MSTTCKMVAETRILGEYGVQEGGAQRGTICGVLV